MAFFSRKSNGPVAVGPSIKPVDLSAASLIIQGLAQTPAASSSGKISAVTEWARASGAPISLENFLVAAEGHAERPWFWLADAQRAAFSAGEHRIALAALFWATYYEREPALHNDRSFQLPIFSRIPGDARESLRAVGKSAAEFLPDDLPVCGDEDGQLTVEVVLALAEQTFGRTDG